MPDGTCPARSPSRLCHLVRPRNRPAVRIAGPYALRVNVEEVIRTAQARTRNSLAEAQALAEAGHWDASFVWGARALEIYYREVLILPLYLAQGEPFDSALERAVNVMKPGWDRAHRELVGLLGKPVEPMLMDDDSDAWTYWTETVPDLRNAIVHGRPGVGASQRLARELLDFVWTMTLQLTLRMVTSGSHPLHDVVMRVLSDASDRIGDDASP